MLPLIVNQFVPKFHFYYYLKVLLPKRLDLNTDNLIRTVNTNFLLWRLISKI